MIRILLVFFSVFSHEMAFSSASSDKSGTADFLYNPSPITISFVAGFGGNPHASRTLYDCFKDELSELKGLEISFDEEFLEMTFFQRDALEVDFIVRTIATAKKLDIGEPFKHLRTISVANTGLVSNSFSISSLSDISWTRESRDALENKRQRLLDASIKHNEIAKNNKQHVKLQQSTKRNLLNAILKNHQGVVIGETHDDHYPKKLLKESMAALSKRGVKALFLENLLYDTMAEPLRNAAMHKDVARIPAHIIEYINQIDKGLEVLRGNPGYLELVKAATAEGIVVIPIDTTHSRLVGWQRDFGIVDRKDRLLAMNFIASTIINAWKEENPDAKFVVLTGFFHATNYQHGGELDEVVGLADQCGVPSVFCGKRSGGSRIKRDAHADLAKENELSKFSVVLKKGRKPAAEKN